ncbi:MAG: methyltransferase family protein [bacterium]
MTKEKTRAVKGHEHRADLAGEHPFGDTGQIILLLLFLTVWIIDSFFLKYSTFISSYVSLYIRLPLSSMLLIIALYITKKSHDIVFGEVREEARVIRKGVFGMLRHPLYCGALLGYCGLFVMTLSLVTLPILIIIIFFYNYIARYEEGILREKLGKEYITYMREVPRWVPRLRRR